MTTATDDARAHAPAPSSFRIATGASAGLALTAAVTWLRWLTWRPYGAWMMAFDGILLVLGGALLFAAMKYLGGRLQPWVAPASSVAGAALGIWGAALSNEEITGVWSLVNGAALLLVAGLGAAMSDRPSAGRVPFAAVGWVACGALALSLAASETQPSLALVLPAALVGLLLLGPRPPSWRPREALALAIPAAATLVFCVVVSPPGSSAAPSGTRLPEAHTTDQDARSLVVIVLDTLRRDHMSLYGYDRATTPHLDAWARKALVFDEMTAASSWTLPSHASLFTGLYSRSHGAHGYRSDRRKNSTYGLGSEVETLAEIAGRAGLATGAIVANHFFLGREWGVDQGFAEYRLLPPRAGFRFAPAEALAQWLVPSRYELHHWAYTRAPFISDQAIDWIRQRGNSPYLLFVNYLDVHRPNRRPATAEIPWQDEIDIPLWFPVLRTVFEHKPIDPQIQRSLVNSYDRELVHLDRELARLLEFLDRDGSRERTSVIITSDHGEFFGEHDLVDHMMHLYREVVNVPLLLKGPGIAPGRSEKRVQTVDLFPTALELLGLDVAASQGTSVLGGEEHPQVSEWYAAANGRLRDARYKKRFEYDIRTIRDDNLRLFLHENGEVELYDVMRDPGETRDLSRERPDDLIRLERALSDWRDAHPSARGIVPEPRPLSAEEHRQLRELGYAD